MTIPNPDQCIIDRSKIFDYSLSFDHPRGKHKAKLFHDLLGFTQNDTDTLISLIRNAVLTNEAVRMKEDKFGLRYSVDFEYKTDNIEVLIRTAWIVRSGEKVARLISCYIV